MRPVPVSDDRWAAEVLEARGFVVVAFHAPGSSPCRAFDPVLGLLAGDLAGRARVMTLDVSANAATAQRYDVSSLPTLLVFRHGRLTGRLVGARPRERLLPELLTYLGRPTA